MQNLRLQVRIVVRGSGNLACPSLDCNKYERLRPAGRFDLRPLLFFPQRQGQAFDAISMSLLVGIALTAIFSIILEGIGLARNSYLSSKSRRQDVAKLWSTCIRTFGLVRGNNLVFVTVF